MAHGNFDWTDENRIELIQTVKKVELEILEKGYDKYPRSMPNHERWRMVGSRLPASFNLIDHNKRWNTCRSQFHFLLTESLKDLSSTNAICVELRENYEEIAGFLPRKTYLLYQRGALDHGKRVCSDFSSDDSEGPEHQAASCGHNVRKRDNSGPSDFVGRHGSRKRAKEVVETSMSQSEEYHDDEVRMSHVKHVLETCTRELGRFNNWAKHQLIPAGKEYVSTTMNCDSPKGYHDLMRECKNKRIAYLIKTELHQVRLTIAEQMEKTTRSLMKDLT